MECECSAESSGYQLNPPLDPLSGFPRVLYLDRPLPISIRLNELATPRQVFTVRNCRQLPIPVSERALNYDATERIKSLAVPKDYNKFSQDPCIPKPFHVCDAALKYRASPRILQLANPTRCECARHRAEKCRKPFEVSPAALNYKPSNNISRLAKPKKSRALKPRSLPIKISESAKNYEPSERIRNLAVPVDKEKTKLKALKNMMLDALAKNQRDPNFYKADKEITKEALEYMASERIKELAKPPCKICPISGKCIPEPLPIRSLKFKTSKRTKRLAKRRLTGESVTSKTKKKTQKEVNEEKLAQKAAHFTALSTPRKIGNYLPDLPLPRPVSAAALAYEPTLQIKKLATPKGHDVPETPAASPTHSEIMEHKYHMTKRIATLALPKAYKQQQECPNENPQKLGTVSRAALKYKATERIKELASPKERKRCSERQLPVKVTKAALGADASSRVLYLSLPKRTFTM